MKNKFLILGAIISLCLGVVGVVLPILPTTPFLLLSGYWFTKSSPRLANWLKNTKLYQFYVADYAETKAIPRAKKKWIIIQILVLMTLSIFLAPLIPVKIGLLVLTVAIVYAVIFRIPNR